MKASEILTFIILIGSLNVLDVNGDAAGLMDIWREVNEEATNDIIKSTMIYKKIKGEQLAMTELETIIKDHLKIKNSELLSNAINTYEVLKSCDKLQNISEYIIENYDEQISEDILSEVISQVLNTKPTSQLVDILWQLYCADDDLKSFEFMIRAQLKLIEVYTVKYKHNYSEFLQKYAFILYKIKQDKLYARVQVYLKSSIDTVVSKFPNNLQYLFFFPYFCLMNAKYSEYIYTTNAFKIDQFSYYIWLWNTKLSIDDMGPIKAEVFESKYGNNRKLKFSLKGIKYQLLYYMMPSTNKVAAWGLKDEPVNYLWDIEFLDNDRVTISQNKYYMCATDDMHDDARRNVAGYKDEIFLNNNEGCQWYLGKCDRR